MEIMGYRDCLAQEIDVAKQKQLVKAGEESFGERLARLRKACGYSLREFAAAAGISSRMVVHYEKHGGSPAVHLAPQMAKALGVSVEQLLGLKEIKTRSRGARDARLWQRFKQIEKLPPAQRKPILQVLDTLLKVQSQRPGE